MAIVLARVDDRLIHGQVTEGWGKKVRPDLVIVVSDDVACSDWECELCLAALPGSSNGLVVSLERAPRAINEHETTPDKVYVLFESPRDAYTVISAGAHITELNVGGMHATEGKRHILDYIYVDDTDVTFLKLIRDAGIVLDFRDLPDHGQVDVMSKL